MHHKAHIGAVNPHTEGISCHHHIRPAGNKGILRKLALLIRHAGVVCHCIHMLGGYFLKHQHHILAGRAIDNPLLPARYHLADALELRLAALAVRNAEIQIIPAKATDNHRRLPQLQGSENVLAHMRRGRGRESHGLRPAQGLPHAPQPQIIRAEIMPPLAQAMRFIHGQQGNLHPPQHLHERLLGKALRRHVENLQLPITQRLHHLAVFLCAQ